MSTSPYTTRSPFGRSPRGKLLTIVAVVVGSVVAFFGYREYRKSIEFEGLVVEKDRSVRWDRAFRPTERESRRYRHYLVVENDVGEQRRLRVRYGTYTSAEEGDPVLKERGDYWPRLMTEEAIERREGSREAMQMIFDAVTDQERD